MIYSLCATSLPKFDEMSQDDKNELYDNVINIIASEPINELIEQYLLSISPISIPTETRFVLDDSSTFNNLI